MKKFLGVEWSRWGKMGIPPAALLGVVLHRGLGWRRADDELVGLVRSFGHAENPGFAATAITLDEAALRLGLCGVVAAILFWGTRQIHRALDRRVGATALVAGLSIGLGVVAAFCSAAPENGYAAVAEWGARGLPVVLLAFAWTASWLLAFAMGALVVERGPHARRDASSRLRVALVLNALLVSFGTVLSVLAYERTRLALRAAGTWREEWEAVWAAMGRSTAAFYVVALAAKYVPAVLLLGPSGASPTEPGESRASGVLGKFGLDLLAILAPVGAELLARLLK